MARAGKKHTRRAEPRSRTRPAAVGTPPRPKSAWLVPALVVLAVVACHANGLLGGLVFDADFIVAKDPRIRETSWASLVAMLGGPYWYGQQTNLFRPVTTLSYWLNYSGMALALRPFGYHATNVALHALNAWLVLRLATRVGLPLLAAAFAALAFGLHPVATEAVANVVGRADLLAVSFALGALLLHTREPSRHTGVEAARAAAIAALAGLAFLSKESGVVVPAGMLLYDVLVRPVRDSDRGTWPRYAAVVATFAAVAFWRAAIFRGEYVAPTTFVDNPLVGASPGVWQLTAFQVFARYLLLLIAPWRLSADYSFDTIPLYGRGGTGDDLAAWGGLLAAAALLAVAWVRRRRSPVLAFGILFAFAAFLPVSNWIVRIGTIMAERLLYLPLVGFALALAAAMPASPRKLASAVAAVWLVFLAGRTVARNFDWASDETIFAATAEASPQSVKMQQVLVAQELARAQRDGTLTRDLGAILARQEQAWAILQRTGLENRYYPVPASLARLQRLAADLPGTASDGRHAALVSSAEAWQAAVDVYRAQWRRERQNVEASGAPLGMGYAEPFVGLADALVQLERYDEAERAAEEAISIAPLDPAPLALGSALARRRGDVDVAALRALERALLDSNSPAAWDELAALRGTEGRPSGILETPEGPRLDVSDESARAELRRAFADLADRLTASGHAALADDLWARSAAYGISRDAAGANRP